MSSNRKQIDYDSNEKKKARTPPRTTLSTTNNVTPNVMLDALGLNPVVETPWPGGTTRHPKTSVLKFAVVRELQQYLIFFALSQMYSRMVTTLKCTCLTLSETRTQLSARI